MKLRTAIQRFLSNPLLTGIPHIDEYLNDKKCRHVQKGEIFLLISEENNKNQVRIEKRYKQKFQIDIWKWHYDKPHILFNDKYSFPLKQFTCHPQKFTVIFAEEGDDLFIFEPPSHFPFIDMLFL